MRQTLKYLKATALMVVVTSGIALAQEDTSGLSFSLNDGATGLGAAIEPRLRIGDSFGLRMPLGIQTSVDVTTENEGLGLTENTRGGVGLLADYYPFGDGVRVGGGLIAGGSRYAVNPGAIINDPAAEQAQGFSQGILESSEDVSGFVRPVVTMGYSRSVSRLSLDLDVGLMMNTGTEDGASEDAAVNSSSADSADQDGFASDLQSLGVAPFVKFGAKLSF